MEKENSNRMRMSLIALAWPIFIETLLRMFLGNVDTFMLGHYSDNAVAAVGAANQIISMVMMVYAVVSTGTLIVISQYLGAKQREKAIDTAATSLILNLIFGIIMSITLTLFAKPILKLMNIPDDIMDYGVQFLRIIGGVSFFQALLSTTAAIMRSFGKAKYAMLVAIGMNIMNVAGNSLFLYGFFGVPVLGVTGVAISSAVSQATAFFIVFFIILKRIGIKLSLKSVIPFQTDLCKKVLSIGIPSAGESIAYQTSQLGITYIITLMGTAALTIRVYTWNIMSFIMLAGISLGQATQIMVGHYVGAGKDEKAYKICLRSFKIGIVIAICVAFIFAALGKTFISILTNDKYIIQQCSRLLWLAIFIEPGRVFNTVIMSSLKAGGDVKFPVAIGVVSMWGTAVGLSYLLGIHFGLGLIGVWIAFGSDEWLRGVIAMLRWRSKVWQKKRVIESNLELGVEN